MNKTDFRKRAYSEPWCRGIQTECEGFICGVSVQPNTTGSVELGYYGENEHEGGSIGFGSSSTVAPAKDTQWNNGNFDDE